MSSLLTRLINYENIVELLLSTSHMAKGYVVVGLSDLGLCNRQLIPSDLKDTQNSTEERRVISDRNDVGEKQNTQQQQ